MSAGWPRPGRGFEGGAASPSLLTPRGQEPAVSVRSRCRRFGSVPCWRRGGLRLPGSVFVAIQPVVERQVHQVVVVHGCGVAAEIGAEDSWRGRGARFEAPLGGRRRGGRQTARRGRVPAYRRAGGPEHRGGSPPPTSSLAAGRGRGMLRAVSFDSSPTGCIAPSSWSHTTALLKPSSMEKWTLSDPVGSGVRGAVPNSLGA